MRSKQRDTLLLIGDKNSDRVALRSTFESKFYILEAESIHQGTLLLQQNSGFIALVLVDAPLEKGEELTDLIEACRPDEKHKIPVICLIDGTGTGHNEEYAFILGADDVVTKPYTTLSIQRRVQILVDLTGHQMNLEKMVGEQSEVIRRNNQVMVDTLSTVLEYRSAESGHHVLRIRRFTKVLLEEVAKNHPEYGLRQHDIDIITSAAALHDIGKVSIPDVILNKPGRLTKDECAVMKTHTTIGSQLVEGLKAMGDEEYLSYIRDITLYHHERWDGKGYPHGLKGDEIPLCAQVVGLVDAYDALTNERVYKKAYSHEKAVSMILNGQCGLFSPELLECFKQVQEEFYDLSQQYADGRDPQSDDIRMPAAEARVDRTAIQPGSALHLSQQKNQALLHYINCTIMEMDMDKRAYHIIYNPNPDFGRLFDGASFAEVPERILNEGMHPDDRHRGSEQFGEGMMQMFHQGVNRYSFSCRMYGALENQYVPYTITLQKVHTDDEKARLLLVIFRREEGTQTQPKRRTALWEVPAIQEMSSASLCIMNDDALTVRQGIGSLTHLTGYQLNEMWSEFSNSLVAMVVSQDQETVRQSLRKKNSRSGKSELVFRLRGKYGPVWVLGKSRTQVDVDGVEYHYATVTEISEVKKKYDLLERSTRRMQVVFDQTDNVFFEWEAATDHMTYSDAWEKRFGYSLERERFSEQLRRGVHFHPDDLPQVRAAARLMAYEGGEGTVVDFRVANADGRYFWSRARAAAVFDEEGKLSHVVGVVYDIDALKSEALNQQQKALKDELTQLLNRNSTQREIQSYLDRRHETNSAAMLMIDIDNFKLVNDNLGHLYGDAMLKQVGTILRSLFRSQDVVGRFGGDEFMVFLKDVPGRELVENKCALLVETLGRQLKKLTPKLPVSISVGAAMTPEDGVNFPALYRSADEALYMAKRQGKNCYHLYSSRDKMELMAAPGNHANPVTRIDSDFRTAMDDNAIVRFVFNSLYESHDTKKTIQEMLAFIGLHFNVSRVYIFEDSEDGSVCNNTFEWCNSGIEPQIQNLQNLNYEEDLPGFREAYDKNGILHCTSIEELTLAVRTIVEPQGIKSMLHCTVFEAGNRRGFMGFDECTANYIWTQEQVAALKLLAGVISTFLVKLRLREKMKGE